MRRSLWLIPLAALLATASLLYAAPSCGKDALFHMQSWLDAAQQLRRGTLYPRFAFLAAFNAGEPRFVFYPPLSWMLGALLTLILPFRFVPTVLTWITLCLAGFSMLRLASRWATPSAALVAACVYLTNPFMLFTVAARSAYGELLAAAFCPLLIAAALEENPSAISLGLPLALMWLSNVPGGVIAAYVLTFLILFRLARLYFSADWSLRRAKSLLLPLCTGFLFALLLDAFYLLPAIHQKPFIQISGAFPEGFRTTDNLFLNRTFDPLKDAFLLQIAHIAATLTLATAAALLLAWWLSLRTAASSRTAAWQRAGIPLLALSAAVMFLLTFLAKPLWLILPMLGVLQFPWRLLFVLATCATAALALLLHNLPRKPWQTIRAAIVVTLALALTANKLYHCNCPPIDTPQGVFTRLLVDHQSSAPTDEYATTGDDTLLRADNPPHWLTPTPNAYAPGTTPTTEEMISDDRTLKQPQQKRLAATELRFTVSTDTPTHLVVNLQDYPNWRITRNGQPVPTRLFRPDGLIVFAIPTGTSLIDIHWHHSWDETLGTLLTTLTLALWAAFTLIRTRRRQTPTR